MDIARDFLGQQIIDNEVARWDPSRRRGELAPKAALIAFQSLDDQTDQ
ncbi:MAG: hypothetical protein ACREVR_19055 [Burkholderiales bacterium]